MIILTTVRIAPQDLNQMIQMQKALSTVAFLTDWHPPSLPVGLPKARKEKAQSN
jgi:hypothetical protein